MAEGDPKKPLGGIAVHKDLEARRDWLFFPDRNSAHLAPKSDEKAEASCLHCSDSVRLLSFVLALHPVHYWIFMM